MNKKKIFTISSLLLLVILLVSGTVIFNQQGKSMKNPGLDPINAKLSDKKIPLNIVGIGDSLTRGVGDPKQQGYAGLTSENLKKLPSVSNMQFTDYGITGDTTTDLLHVLQQKKVQNSIKHADYIFMTIGGNDLVAILKKHFLNLKMSDFNGPQHVFAAHLKDIFSQIRKLNPKATIYYAGLYNPFEDYVAGLDQKFSDIIFKWNQSIQQIVKKDGNAYYVPTFDIFHKHTKTLLYTDHFHPNEKGYVLVSNRLFNTIKKTTEEASNNYKP